MQETQETQVQSLGQEKPQEQEVATHSSILAWKIPRTEEPGGLQSTGSQRLGHNLATEQQIISASTATTYLFFIVQMNQLYHLYAHYSIHL